MNWMNRGSNPGMHNKCFSSPKGPAGPGSVVGIATGFGLNGPGIESWWGRDFPHLSILALGPTQPPYNVYRVFPGGKERPGRDADPSPPSSAVGHERVELYLYSPYGPYGLYRASVPVQGCTLPLLLKGPDRQWGRSAKLSTRLHTASMLKSSGAIPLLPLDAFVAGTGKTSPVFLFSTCRIFKKVVFMSYINSM